MAQEEPKIKDRRRVVNEFEERAREALDALQDLHRLAPGGRIPADWRNRLLKALRDTPAGRAGRPIKNAVRDEAIVTAFLLFDAKRISGNEAGSLAHFYEDIARDRNVELGLIDGILRKARERIDEARARHKTTIQALLRSRPTGGDAANLRRQLRRIDALEDRAAQARSRKKAE